MSEAIRVDLGTHSLTVYRERGNAEPCVFLHGFLETSVGFQDLTRELRGSVDAVLVDLRAHGQSSAPDASPSLPGLACDIVGILDHFAIERASG